MTDLTDIKTNDYGELSVQLATVGEVTGSDTEGKPIKQNFTEEAFQKIADDVNASGESIPVDKDHASMRPGLNRDTESMGWISRLWANAKGLFGWLKFTRKGRELAEDRAYRFLSPSFVLDKSGEPMKLLNAAYTNQPACIGTLPILNNKPFEKDVLDMTKEELVALIQETVAAMNSTPTETEEVETVNAKPVETTCNSCGEDEEKKTVDEKPEEEIVEEVKEEVTETPDTPTEEVKEEIKEEIKEEVKEEVKEEDDDEKEEVIKLEALNSRPNILTEVKGGKDWRNLHGDEFFKYLKAHKAEMVEECRN